MEKEILGYDGKYTITENGDVFSYTWGKKRKLKPQKASQSKKGYLQVRLFSPNKEDARRNAKGIKQGRLQYVHRLVYETFVGDIPKHLTVDHINGDTQNNHPSNLQLLPIRKNVEKYHVKKRGTIFRFHREEMIKDYKELKSYRKVAKKWNCSDTSVYRIIKDRLHTYNRETGKWGTRRYSDFKDEFTEIELGTKKGREFKDGL